MQGEFDLEVVAGSMAPLDRAITMTTLMQLIPELQQLGVMPGGPVAAAIGGILAEGLEMPEINKAMKEEADIKKQQMEKQDQEAQGMKDLNIAQATSKMTIEAANVGIKQNKLTIEALKHSTPSGDALVQSKKDKNKK